MDSFDIALLAAAGFAGGFVNAIAGGGTFFTLPALMMAGVPPVAAGATSGVAIWPGHAMAVVGYDRRRIAALLAASGWTALGAALGALLLLSSGDLLFRSLVPWLILAATLLFLAAPHLARLPLAGRAAGRGWRRRLSDAAVAVYGGFFGAGLGVLLLAQLVAAGAADLREANAVKNVRATLVTSVAAAVFLASGAVAWWEGALVLFGAIAGGLAGGRATRRIRPGLLRWLVVAVGFGLFLGYLV